MKNTIHFREPEKLTMVELLKSYYRPIPLIKMDSNLNIILTNQKYSEVLFLNTICLHSLPGEVKVLILRSGCRTQSNMIALICGI